MSSFVTLVLSSKSVIISGRNGSIKYITSIIWIARAISNSLRQGNCSFGRTFHISFNKYVRSFLSKRSMILLYLVHCSLKLLSFEIVRQYSSYRLLPILLMFLMKGERSTLPSSSRLNFRTVNSPEHSTT